MSNDRLDWIYAQKPVPTVHVYLDLVGQELYELCRMIPLPEQDVEFMQEGARRRFAEHLDEMRPPTRELTLLIADLLEWELGREYERIDDFMRNERYRGAAPTAGDVHTMHFLQQVLLDRLLERQEHSSHPVRRQELLRAVESLRRCARLQGDA
jgi:hypothetical protein